jgi:lysine 6-dehydrogenase
MPSHTPPYRYVVLGAGRQGTAAAYDLAKFGEAGEILLADLQGETAQAAAERVDRLVGREVAQGRQIDVSDPAELKAALAGADVVLSAVPYYYNLEITRTAIGVGASLCDMGGHTGVVREQLALDANAKAAGVSVVPDCGMGPGLNITMGAYAIELLDEPRAIHIYDGGLPQNPQPPWLYQLTFHINGLTNEMDGQAVYVRERRIVYVDTLSEPEFVDFPPLGKLEADVTSGGLSTAPWYFQNLVERFENKTLRYPGHFEWLRAFKELGLFSETHIDVDGQEVVPRQLFHTLLEPKITAPEIHDVCVIRVKGLGIKDGKETTVVIDLIDYYDPATGFTAMERLTGWHCAIMMGFQARGQVPPGGVSMEGAVKPSVFMEAVRERGIEFTVRYE